MWVFIGSECPERKMAEFKRNPNLEIFLSDSLSNFHLNYFSPIWAPSGDKIYCIARKEEENRIRHMLIYITLPNKKIFTVVKDSVMLFTLSHEGNEIAYVKGTSDWDPFPGEHIEPLIEEKIVFINLLTGERKIFSPSCPYVEDLKYTHDDKFLIFLAKGDTSISGFYSLDLSTWKETLILKIPLTKEDIASFILHPQSDSIIKGMSENMWYPQFNPTNSNMLCTVKDWSFTDLWKENSEDEEIFLLDLSTGDKKPLNAKPYYYTDIGRVSFSPDGSKIIFSAARPDIFEGGIFFDYQELWILNLK
jgi:Tol biopolymer transport system component